MAQRGDFVRGDVDMDARIHAEGQHLAARCHALKRLFERVAGRLDHDIGLATIGEIGDLLDDVHFVRVPDRQPALLRHADAERVNFGHRDLGRDILGELGEEVTDGTEAEDHDIES